MYINFRSEKIQIKKKDNVINYKRINKNKIYTIGLLDGNKLTIIGVSGSFNTNQFVYSDGSEIPTTLYKKYNYYRADILEKNGCVICIDNSIYPNLKKFKLYKATPVYYGTNNYKTDKIFIEDIKYKKSYFRVLKDKKEIDLYTRKGKLKHIFGDSL